MGTKFPNQTNSTDKQETAISQNLSGIITRMLFRTIRFSLMQPKIAWSVLKLMQAQFSFARIRKQTCTDELVIPPFLIYSITRSCNLNCKGCYAKVHQAGIKQEMSIKQTLSLFTQAQDLGIGIIMLAGGEPFTRRSVINLCNTFPRILFPVFTNGLLLNKAVIKGMTRNLIPVISLEGSQAYTDERRGQDVYSILKERYILLQTYKRFWGVSLTVTQDNITEMVSAGFIQKMVKAGCKLFFFVEYVPISPDGGALVLTDDNKALLVSRTDAFSKTYPALFIAFPGDEDKWGGCLAAGRGFVHIQADGSLEPCPFAPYSDVSVADIPLKDALKSEFLSKIRKKHHLLHEAKGGCALWENRETVKQLLDSED
jgi:MoaA/NifB/PqqE/SkfB family radical SAM enzyme